MSMRKGEKFLYPLLRSKFLKTLVATLLKKNNSLQNFAQVELKEIQAFFLHIFIKTSTSKKQNYSHIVQIQALNLTNNENLHDNHKFLSAAL